jgi:transcriptional regulator with XRE-family HTH domain
MSTALQNIGSALRALRMGQSMSQEALATAAGISRTTLIQIEKGKDAQASSIQGAAQVLGAEFGILSEPPHMALRRQARADLQAKQAASREKHLKIAVKLALGGDEAEALKADALRMVQLWKDRQLCSPVYIARWQLILDAAPSAIAHSMLHMDDARGEAVDNDWGPAMRQNTPFAVTAV